MIRPYNSQIINNPYNIREIRIMWQVCRRVAILLFRDCTAVVLRRHGGDGGATAVLVRYHSGHGGATAVMAVPRRPHCGLA